MDRIWLNAYPEGIPADIDPDGPASLRDVLEASFRRFRDRPAFSCMGRRLSYGQMDGLSRAFGAFLHQTLGLNKGDRLAIMLPNLLQYPVALFGALRAGLTVVNVNPQYTAAELEQQLTDADAAAILVLENFAATVQQVLDRTPLTTVITTQAGDLLPFPKSLLVNLAVKYIQRKVPPWRIPGAIGFDEALQAGGRQTLNAVPLGHDDAAFLQYTGGTTGTPKGALLTHGNLVANLLQAEAWIKPWVRDGEEIIVTALPLYHIFSLMANGLLFARLGAESLLITDPRNLPAFVKALHGVRFTAITGVNTLFNGLLDTAGFDALDFSGLKITLGGGAAVHKAVAERWQAVTGCPLVEAYGLTETSPAVCVNPLDIDGYTGSIGLPIPSTEVAILDDDGRELAVGQTGELGVRGPQVMKAYWRRPEETAGAFTADGWLKTGDMACMDPRGYVRLIDRKKDVILVSGFN
ncbi:MAG: AMP-binding protein, partial [Pseudomonadota bacterium]|nr:AMP-binding protein [Pseudomonadota bacterium]